MRNLQETLLKQLSTKFPSFVWYNNLVDGKVSISLQTLTGSQVVESYLDGSRDLAYNMELTGCTKLENAKSLNDTLITISEYLSDLEELEGYEGFLGCDIVSEPHFYEATEDNTAYFMLTFVVYVYKNK